MAEQLQIVGTTYTMQALVPGGVERCHAQMSAHLPAGTALTPHAPAQSALDEANAIIEQRNAMCSAYFAEVAELCREVEALRADAERYRWLRNKAAGWIRNHCSLCIASTTPKNTTAVYGKDADELIDTARASTDEGVGK